MYVYTYPGRNYRQVEVGLLTRIMYITATSRCACIYMYTAAAAVMTDEKELAKRERERNIYVSCCCNSIRREWALERELFKCEFENACLIDWERLYIIVFTAFPRRHLCFENIQSITRRLLRTRFFFSQKYILRRSACVFVYYGIKQLRIRIISIFFFFSIKIILPHVNATDRRASVITRVTFFSLSDSRSIIPRTSYAKQYEIARLLSFNSPCVLWIY